MYSFTVLPKLKTYWEDSLWWTSSTFLIVNIIEKKFFNTKKEKEEKIQPLIEQHQVEINWEKLNLNLVEQKKYRSIFIFYFLFLF